jgi:hypothetical protein
VELYEVLALRSLVIFQLDVLVLGIPGLGSARTYSCSNAWLQRDKGWTYLHQRSFHTILDRHFGQPGVPLFIRPHHLRAIRARSALILIRVAFVRLSFIATLENTERNVFSGPGYMGPFHFLYLLGTGIVYFTSASDYHAPLLDLRFLTM